MDLRNGVPIEISSQSFSAAVMSIFDQNFQVVKKLIEVNKTFITQSF